MEKTKNKMRKTTIELTDEQYFFAVFLSKREISCIAEAEQKSFYYFYYPGFD